MTKSLRQIWDQVPVDYYQKGVQKNLLQKVWHDQKIKTAKKLIKKYQFNNCLDVGCASGYMISRIQKSYPAKKFYGVDVYENAIGFAKTQYPKINFITASGDKLPFKKNYFDLVICYETIEHVKNPAQTLKEIKRVMKKNGTLILAMDSGNMLFRLVWLMWENSLGNVWKDAHLNEFHHTELERLVTKQGFHISQKLFSHLGMEVIFILNK